MIDLSQPIEVLNALQSAETPEQIHVGFRATLRMLPRAIQKTSSIMPLAEYMFFTCRSLITSYCFAVEPDQALRAAAKQASALALEFGSDDVLQDSGFCALACVDGETPTSRIERALSARSFMVSQRASEIGRDLDELAKLDRNLSASTLWEDETPPSLASNWEYLLGVNPELFSFWREWYQGFLDGEPLDWELQRRVALIEDEIWEAGPEAVAEEIEKIRAKFDLEKRIEALEAERDSLIAEKTRHGIGGNNPPENMKIEAEVRETVTLIWADIDALKEEVEKPSPLKTNVAALIERLSAGMKALLALCGRLGEHALKVAVAAEVVKHVNPDLLHAVIEATKRWLSTL